MKTIIFDVLLYSMLPIGAIYIAISLICKIILKNSGFKVDFIILFSLSDIRKMNKLTKEEKDLRVLYYGLLISTIGFLSLFLLAFIEILIALL